MPKIRLTKTSTPGSAGAKKTTLTQVSQPAPADTTNIVLPRVDESTSQPDSGQTTITPVPPLVTGDDITNTLSASHALGNSEILYSINNGSYQQYTGTINVGDVTLSEGYYKFKIKSATNRNESSVANSPAFTVASGSDEVTISGLNYTLPSTKRVSIGIYDINNVLLRNLKKGETQTAGTYSLNWDGTNDFLSSLPITTYKAKLITNNVNYEWQGIIGNTSTYQTGPTIHRSLDAPIGMVINGNKAVYCIGYGEGEGGNGGFLLDNVQEKLHPMPYDNTGQNSDYVVSDGTNIYWAGYDAFIQGHSFMFATKVSDNSEVSFSSGINMPVLYAHTYSSAIGYEDGERNQSFAFNSNLATTYTINDSFPEIYVYRVEITGGGIPENDPKKLFPDRLVITNNNKTVRIDNLDGATVGSGATVKILYWQKKWITGIAVSSNFIFIARKNINEVRVLNKTTGAVVQTLTMTSPTALTASGTTLWLTTNTNTVKKYTINSNGTLTDTGVSSAMTFAAPVTMTNNGSLVGVVDGLSSQQVKAFDFNTGATAWTLGQVGGNVTSPVVANDRFGFWKYNPDTYEKMPYGSITFAPDGSFWVCDPANMKMAHFAANRTYIEAIQYTGRAYSLTVDMANPTNVINTMHQYQVDYTSSIKQSWIYKYNWSSWITINYDILYQIRHMCTLSNGRMYAIMKRRDNGQAELVELDPSTGIRYTGLQFEGTAKIYADGSIGEMVNGGIGETQYFYKRNLTGFSGNNPIYSSRVTLATHSNTSTNEPRNGSITIYPTEVTSTGILTLYKGGRVKGETNSYHLGGFDLATGTVKWKTATPTHDTYAGDFPDNGDFEVGNFGPNDGSQGDAAMAIDRNIFTHYFGEFWKAGQTNIFNHYWDNGLFVGQFGTDSDTITEIAGAKFSGNGFSPAIVKVGSDYYMYGNDESHHGGTHRWKITGLNTIKEYELSIPSSYTRVNEKPVVGTNLMANVPYLSTNLPSSVGVVTRFPATNEGGWNVITNRRVYGQRNIPDIFAEWATAKNCNITFDLGNDTNLSNWIIRGKVAFDQSMPSETNKMVVKVVDSSNRIIAQFNRDIDFSDFLVRYKAHTTQIGTPSTRSKYEQREKKNQLLEFARNGSNITYKFSDFSPVTIPLIDSSATIGSPKKLIVEFQYNGGGIYGKSISLQNFVFIPTI